MYVVGIRRCKNKKLGFAGLFSVACEDDYGESVFSEGKPTRPPQECFSRPHFYQVCLVCLVSLFLEGIWY